MFSPHSRFLKHAFVAASGMVKGAGSRMVEGTGSRLWFIPIFSPHSRFLKHIFVATLGMVEGTGSRLWFNCNIQSTVVKACVCCYVGDGGGDRVKIVV